MIRLALRVRREDAEVALAELLELAPSGVEEVDRGDVVEYAVYGPPGEIPDLPDLVAAAGGALVEVVTTEVADDWSERWRDFHVPLVLPGLTVRAPWHEPAGTGLDVVVDPGQAFGTGAHATTRLCLELLLGLEPAGPFLDLGCGSGVLAIVAAHLGFGPVSALDHDPLAVTATAENAAVNGVAVDVEAYDLRDDGPGPAEATVAANLLRPLLERYAAVLAAAVPERLIVSGLLEAEADEAVAAFAPHGLHEQDRRTLQGWSAALLTRG